MSNYTPSTNFTAKDNLVSGNPSKLVKGTEIQAELDAIAVSIATKSNTADIVLATGGTYTGAVYGVTPATSDDSTKFATTEFVNNVATNAALPSQTLGLLTSDGVNASFSKNLTGFAVNTVRATVASHATTADIWGAAGNEIDFTGTATVTDFPDAPVAGSCRILHCAAACTFTNNANLSVQGAANYTASAGDIVTVHAITTSTFRLTIDRADGLAITSGLTLLAVLTPTAAANVDFLNTFTSDYDNILIQGRGILPSALDTFRMRLAVAGSADSGSNYYPNATFNTSVTASSTSLAISTGTTVLETGKGLNFELMISNVNDATNLKTVFGRSGWQSDATPTYINSLPTCTYKGANAVSGIRFYWESGANFAAQGKIRISGYCNTRGGL